MTNRLLVIIGVFACLVFSFFFFSTSQNAQTFPITVGNTSDTVVAGACVAGASTPDCSLRGAIQAANSNASFSLITFGIPASDPSCAVGVCTINLTSPLPDISTIMSISGPGADKLTVRPGTGVNIRFFNVTATGTVGISGITVSNADPFSGVGGAIANFGATLNISNCTIRNNRAPSFGGGGIYNSSGTVTVSNSTIDGNTSPGNAGGISNVGIVNVINTIISNNHSTQGNGGGIHSSGTANIINSTINGNTAGSGAAIFASAGTLNLSNSTITGNSANNGDGGGMYIQSTATANVKSSIIAMNSAPMSGQDFFGSVVSAGFNLIGKRDGSTGFTAATDQTGTIASPLNPMLDPEGPQNNGGPTLTIALVPGSPAIDKGTSNGLTGGLTTDQRGGTFLRLVENFAIPNAVGGNGADIGALELVSKSPADFDGDNKTDIGIFRPVPAEWWINRSSTGVTFATQFGSTTDKLVPGDYTGDGMADIAIWRPATGQWFILRSEDFTFFAFPFGLNGDIPVPAEYQGDNKIDHAVFRPSTGTWFISNSFNFEIIIRQFGVNGDLPVPGDYDGDGASDIAIFRPSNGQWWLNRSTAGVIATTFGNSSDKPAQGDYTGDGKADIAFWRPSTGQWFVLRSEDFSFFSFSFGTTGDIPAPGDYDGDGRFDATVFRPSNATWFSNQSTAGILIQQFGVNGDRPIPSAFVP